MVSNRDSATRRYQSRKKLGEHVRFTFRCDPRTWQAFREIAIRERRSVADLLRAVVRSEIERVRNDTLAGTYRPDNRA